jgi:hypothetical protein
MWWINLYCDSGESDLNIVAGSSQGNGRAEPGKSCTYYANLQASSIRPRFHDHLQAELEQQNIG